MLPTPNYRLTEKQKESVYDPAEDSFLLMDAIEMEIEVLRTLGPRVAVEVGVGSGVISAFLAKALEGHCKLISLGTDRNPDACDATRETARLNAVAIDVVQCDLVSALLPRVAGFVDVLMFNPPYVPTSDEAASDLERCWAGGEKGISTLNRFLPIVPDLLSARGLFYLVALKENDIPALLTHNPRLRGSVVVERRAGIEYLYILKFEKNQ